jgi:hypothetical protein
MRSRTGYQPKNMSGCTAAPKLAPAVDLWTMRLRRPFAHNLHSETNCFLLNMGIKIQVAWVKGLTQAASFPSLYVGPGCGNDIYGIC